MKATQAGPKRRRLQCERDLDADVAKGIVTQQVLERKLFEHVESVDASMVCYLSNRSLPALNPILATFVL